MGEIELSARWRDKQGNRGVVRYLHPILYQKARYRACLWIPPAGWSNVWNSKSVADEHVARYGRMVRFISATGLKQSKAHWPYLGVKYGEHPPEADHTLFWHDGKKNYAVTTDPYGGHHNVDKMHEWCERKGWRMAAAPEGGLWYPGTTLVVLAPAKSGIDVDWILERAVEARCLIRSKWPNGST